MCDQINIFHKKNSVLSAFSYLQCVPTYVLSHLHFHTLCRHAAAAAQRLALFKLKNACTFCLPNDVQSIKVVCVK